MSRNIYSRISPFSSCAAGSPRRGAHIAPSDTPGRRLLPCSVPLPFWSAPLPPIHGTVFTDAWSSSPATRSTAPFARRPSSVLPPDPNGLEIQQANCSIGSECHVVTFGIAVTDTARGAKALRGNPLGGSKQLV